MKPLLYQQEQVTQTSVALNGTVASNIQGRKSFLGLKDCVQRCTCGFTFVTALATFCEAQMMKLLTYFILLHNKDLEVNK